MNIWKSSFLQTRLPWMWYDRNNNNNNSLSHHLINQPFLQIESLKYAIIVYSERILQNASTAWRRIDPLSSTTTLHVMGDRSWWTWASTRARVDRNRVARYQKSISLCLARRIVAKLTLTSHSDASLTSLASGETLNTAGSILSTDCFKTFTERSYHSSTRRARCLSPSCYLVRQELMLPTTCRGWYGQYGRHLSLAWG